MDKHAEREYEFRFALDEREEPVMYEDPFTEMVRRQLEAMLDVVALTANDADVQVDGFRFVSQPGSTFRIFPADE